MQMFSITSPNTWAALNATVGGRLFGGLPLAYSCIQDSTSPQCSNVTHNYLDEVFRTNHVGGFVNAQWESCQATGEQCLLDYTNTSDLRPITGGDGCHPGSVSKFYIDVREPSDVSAAFAFSTDNHVPLVVKNTGHDYKGRSSAPATLGLWISYSAEFIPEGCSDTPASTPAVTIGAGVQWYEAYAFAEANNITLVGGTDRSVGASGGWLMASSLLSSVTKGGGHSLLSNTMGLGVDRVVQFKVVTPDGQYRTASACQNQDLFYALRGATSIASPPVTLQTVIVSFSPTSDPSLTEEMWSIMVANSAKWAEDGWGGISNQQAAIYINPVLDAAAAKESMAPLIEFGQRLLALKKANASLVVTTFPTWYSFFTVFSSQFVARSGIPVALTSRLLSKSNFETTASQKELVSALTAANDATGSVILLFSTPASYPGDDATSVTDAWRDSLTHVTLVTTWNWNATKAEKEGQYTLASSAIDHLRKITPDAAYVNEADVYEPNHEATFWGTHYDKLLAIKQKYDPNQLLDCWHCVGWKPASSLYQCYLPRD
ncbi:FAD-binding domain-containing protein [Mucidula mucida]|nr:FAD-binding domain-containing protein [Mucidula mucida]